METPVIRNDVRVYLRASLAFAEFCRHNKLTTTEREALESLAHTLGLNIHHVSSSDSPPQSFNDSNAS